MGKLQSIADIPDREIDVAAEEFGKGASHKTVEEYARRFNCPVDTVSDDLRTVIEALTTKAFASGFRVARNVQQEFEKGMN